MIQKHIGKKRGFTIVETLVAIAILMIAIAGPLTIAQKGLTASIYARDQSVASFLAQDYMEAIKNIRDTNKKGGTADWLENIRACESGAQCTFDTRYPQDGYQYTIVVDGDWTVFKSVNGGYSSDSNGIPSQFSQRSFYVIETIPDVEALVVVTVAWRNGTLSNTVTLENYMYNIFR